MTCKLLRDSVGTGYAKENEGAVGTDWSIMKKYNLTSDIFGPIVAEISRVNMQDWKVDGNVG